MNSIIIKLNKAVATIEVIKEIESTTFIPNVYDKKTEEFITFSADKRIEDLVIYFAKNTIIDSFSNETIDGEENIVFKDTKNNHSITFIIQDEKQEYGLNYIGYLIAKYNEDKKRFYEKEKEVRNINIALSTSGSYYEKVNDETVNYVIYVSNDKVAAEELDFVRCVLEELISNTHQSMTSREKESIILIQTEKNIITIPKILFLKVNNIIRNRKKLKKLAFKKEGN